MHYFETQSAFIVEEKDIQNELASIRNLMERSSKFISLSGLSGVLAGIYALIGAIATYCVMGKAINYDQIPFLHLLGVLPLLVVIAVGVLIASILTGILLSYQKAKRKSQQFWSKTSRELLFHMIVPLLTGGILVLLLLYRSYFGIVAPCMLIFYGLALIGASNFTFTDVKFLGLCEIALGLIAAALPSYGLLFWALGFGVLHIVYGSVMYFKYDR